MDESNHTKARRICGCDKCSAPCVNNDSNTGAPCITFNYVIEMAELKDKAIKQFFIEHISAGVEVETNENGEPLAESFIEASKARFAAAEKVYARFKEFEERF